MASNKTYIPSIHDINKFLKEESFLPVYFLLGDDSYTIDQALKVIQKKTEYLITSDFDREVITVEKGMSANQVIDSASAFPFGGDKKLLVIKNFEKLTDKKAFESYFENPAEFTILVLANYGKINDFNKSPFSKLLNNSYAFEAKELRGDEWVYWLVRTAKKEKLILSEDNARTIVEMVGEDKGLLEMQINKFYDFIGPNQEITIEQIEKLTSSTKEYTIFNLQDALGRGDKKRSLEIGYNLIDSGLDIVFIISMLTKFITTIAQALDLMKKKLQDNMAAKEAKVSYYYFINCKKAKFFLNDSRLYNAANALLKADVTNKTSSVNNKTLLTILLTEMLES